MIKSLLATTALAAFTLSAQAVTVVQWNFEAATFPGTGTSWTGIAPSSGSGTASGVHAATTTWSTPVGNGTARSASANTWAVGDYWQFSFSSVGFTGLNVSFDQTGSGTGPRDFTLAYSTNGSTFTNFASYTVLQNGTPGPAAWNGTTFNSLYTLSFDLSAVTALDNTATVFVRLVDASTTSIGGATVASGGTNRVDNFTVNMTPVPEASTSAMLLAGLAALGFMAKRRKA